MKRRYFFTLIGVSSLVSSLLMKVRASGPKTTTISSASGDWQKVGTVAELDKAGQLLNEKSPIGSVLVVGTSKSKKLIAVNPTCTHMGCTVEWLNKEGIFLCPCHASEFKLDGKAQTGPATKPLSTYATKIEGNFVMVKRI
ncbi:MAG: Rieske 2Fe-2S domain-containing protein [Brasilonema octagenarum HA4186-MV1]|jgi:cytochrome b6-f complex iron-sulfur subunit|uniref:Cytochrome B6 n=1 Tax=Brasilonema sennae CENA114 TaxID=415709 RepID=A0A856MI16_9CYAN|nr:ubiquinol-cytochrome c reductase iron-sulfur subunit [Brasilonema sennae]MBW4629356.1 Rieske 2Fe-2S domain-containing protein [Brasilonema octagenarum HA4186-MV1]QDL09899.1 cytochrome B6 [Brasilonema sennae CENA114]QDL16251.1 cytochrome B6 [Brasilonema octagenarum UFV-E1]